MDLLRSLLIASPKGFSSLIFEFRGEDLMFQMLEICPYFVGQLGVVVELSLGHFLRLVPFSEHELAFPH